MRNLILSLVLIGLAQLGFNSPNSRAAEFKLAWEYSTPKDLPMAVVADQSQRPYLYVALKSGGLGVLDVSNQSRTPRQVARIDIKKLRQMDVMNLAQRGKKLYLALGGHFAPQGTKHAGLAIVNVVNPARPRVSSVWKSAEKLKGGAVVAVEGKYAYLGVMSAGVMTFDVSNSAKIEHVSTFQPDVNFPRRKPGKVQHPNARGLSVRGDLLFVANDAGGLRALDMRNRTQPKEIGRYINQTMIGKQQAYNNIVIEGKQAYIAVDYAGLEIVDTSNPRQMRQIGWWNPWDAHTLKNLWFNSPGHTNQLVVDTKEKRVYLSAGDSELLVVDVSVPSRPRLANQFGKPKNKLAVWGMTAREDQIYLTYIKAFVPFQSSWSGIKAVNRR